MTSPLLSQQMALLAGLFTKRHSLAGKLLGLMQSGSKLSAASMPLSVVLETETIDQFEYDGCDNCESYLQMKGNREMVYECTSSSFDGVIAMMSPEDSWVAKWQRIGNFKPGVYAVSVTGRLPPGVVRELKSRGVIYKSRDTAVKT
ncbi:transcription elongation factor SPT4 isoform X1 [Thunnus albacares]|uniref:transcription elongation factor SPT4 isoform X1 n=1 Tax=Thunnus maccoyii TaxID=8240 RepID=UPI001C4B6E6E|nr:transcription elongation factor SPT4 isoform X1 [Thunnus maccoyii]XP_044226296.1 transcription elongation factor SPT4 isoform X1 [Thunnus albacares]